MDYDGLSSPELQQTPPEVAGAASRASRFVILWHAISPPKAIADHEDVRQPFEADTANRVRQPFQADASKGEVSLERLTYVNLDKSLSFFPGRSSHFDLMLEKDGRLTTFELLQLPIPGERFPVRRLAEHRIDYLDYEGPVSGDRGHVTKWTAGHYLTFAETEEKWVVALHSPRLAARLVLLRPSSDNIESLSVWYLRASRWNVTR